MVSIMKKVVQALFVIFVTFYIPVSNAADQASVSGAVSVVSENNFEYTYMQVIDGLKTEGFEIKNQIDHQKIAVSLGHVIP